MKKLKTSLAWLDTHILKALVFGFIVLIPLYPKLPLRMINYTYVAVRLEDIYLAIMVGVFFVQLLRKRVVLPRYLTILFVIYWALNFISYLYGYFVQNTVIINHLGLLHSLRRVEYMSIFFIAYATVKSKRDFFQYLSLMLVVLGIVSIYGMGQKFLGWPAVQTMNPEFAKGYILVLESWSRISSTFAGHYDLSAYLIVLMTVLIGFYLYTNKKAYLGLFLISLGALVLAGSRASYLAYVGVMILYLGYVKKIKLLIFVLVATAIFTPLSDNLSNRLSRTFQQTKVYVDSETGDAFVARNIVPDDLPPGDFGASSEIPAVGSGVKLTEKEEVQAKKQIRESIAKQAQDVGKQYTVEELNLLVEQMFARQIPMIKYLPDISISTRLQVSWPRAFRAFTKNFLIGSGPSSLGEATDGDYLRWLGEVGILGTTALLSIFAVIALRIFKAARRMNKRDSYLFHGFVFAFIALFVNASYIDIFEASKVAYTFWLLAGIYYAGIHYFHAKRIPVRQLKV